MAIDEVRAFHVQEKVEVPQRLIRDVETLMQRLVFKSPAPQNGMEPSAQQAAAYRLMSGGQRIQEQLALALAAASEALADLLARRAAGSFAAEYQVFDDLNDVQQELLPTTAQPAINVVALIEARNPGEDARALARQLAATHLEKAAEYSVLLPHHGGQMLGQFARDLCARISLSTP